jgi:hypothetical protein
MHHRVLFRAIFFLPKLQQAHREERYSKEIEERLQQNKQLKNSINTLFAHPADYRYL